MEKKKIKAIFVLITLLVFIGLLLNCGGSSTTSKLSQEVRSSIQNTMATEAPFKDQSIVINNVNLENFGDFTFKGIVNMTVSGVKHDINLDVISDGQNIVWYIEPTELEFLNNSPTETLRVGIRSENIIGNINSGNITQPNERTDFKYDLNNTRDGVIILEYVGTRNNVVVPVMIEDFPVVEIASGAFRGNENITSVVLPPIRAIFDNTFRDCKNLAFITLPDTLLFIGDNAFYDCQSLVSITIPENVTNIGRAAFYNCVSLSSITLPNALESIERSTFMNCTFNVNKLSPQQLDLWL